MRQAVHAFDIPDTHEPSSALLEEIAERTWRLFPNDTVDTSAGETSPPCLEKKTKRKCELKSISTCHLQNAWLTIL